MFYIFIDIFLKTYMSNINIKNCKNCVLIFKNRKFDTKNIKFSIKNRKFNFQMIKF